MASIINASTAGVGGVITTADNSGDLNIQSGGTTVATVSSTGVAVTGTLSSTGNITAGSPAVTPPLSGISIGAQTATGSELVLKNSSGIVNQELIGGVAFGHDDPTGGTGPHYSGIQARSTDSSGTMVLNFFTGLTTYETGTGEILQLSDTGATLTGDLTTTGNTILGNASTDTLNVGNGGLIKDASGRIVSGGDIYLGGAGVYTASEASIVYNGNGDLILNADPNNISASSNLICKVDSTERMRIDASGNLLVGLTSGIVGGARISIQSAGSVSIETNATSTYYPMWFQSSGVQKGYIQTTSSATTYNTTSDYRLKENIAPMTGALSTVAKLKPVTYNWKVDGSDGQGFIAHELAEVVPDCVSGEKDATKEEQYEISPAIPAVLDEEGNEVTPAVEAVMGTRTVPVYQGIDTSFLVATLTAALQEQQAMIDELKAKVATLENK